MIETTNISRCTKFAGSYAREVQKLITTLNEPGHSEEAAGLIRGLIDKIVLTPDASKTRLIVDLEGDLAGILAMSADQAPLKRPDLLDIDTFGAFSSLSYRLGESVSHKVVGINGCGRAPNGTPAKQGSL